MTKFQIASLPLKLVGIFSILQAIPILKSLSEVFAYRWSGISHMEGWPLYTKIILIGILSTIFLLVLIGITLIIFSGTLAKRIVTDDKNKESLSELSSKNIQSIAFSIVGLVMIVFAIPKLIQIGINLQALKNLGIDSPKESISVGTWSYSIGLVVQLIIGILLFLGARGLSNIWHYLQKIRPMKNVE